MQNKRPFTTSIAVLVIIGGSLLSPSAAQAVTAPIKTTSITQSGKFILHGAIRNKWLAGKNSSLLGAATSNETKAGTGVAQTFQSSTVYWSAKTGAFSVVRGDIKTYYDRKGGVLGLPTSDKTAWNGGYYQKFDNGVITWGPTIGARTIAKEHFAVMAAKFSTYGWPTKDTVTTATEIRTQFQKSLLATGRFSVVRGDIKTYYDRKGGAAGVIGLPTSNKTAWNSGFYQKFENGVITWGPGIGSRFITNEHFTELAGHFATYGWPTKDTEITATSVRTQFQKTFFATGLNGAVYPFSASVADANTVVLYGDSQLDGNAWSEQGARAMGFTTQYSLAYGGMGYSTRNAIAQGTGWEALRQGHIPFPSGTPGLVLINLGGNDASSSRTDAQVIADSTATWAKVKKMYPNSKIIVNGVMSRTDAAHVKRRHIDAVLAANAKKQGVTYISVAGMATTANAEYRDNVHMTQAGHDAVAKLYTPLLKAALG